MKISMILPIYNESSTICLLYTSDAADEAFVGSVRCV